MSETLTAVSGVRVGHAEVSGGGSGCTVVLGPFRGGVEVRGLATGTRELDALSPEHLVPRIDAVLLTGGSAFGLGAADGVMEWLAARGVGFDTGVAPVPIVPTAVIFDLAEGVGRPGPVEGRDACEAASGEPVAEGRVGAGAGALVGKIGGRDGASPGGIGSAGDRLDDDAVGALVVVNALGDVLDERGEILAGARGGDGSFLDTARTLTTRGALGGFGDARPGTNTTLVVVATDAALSAADLQRTARMAATGLARRISPVNTPFDGDVVFALTTAEDRTRVSPGRVTALGTLARDLVEESIERAVRAGAETVERSGGDSGDDAGPDPGGVES